MTMGCRTLMNKKGRYKDKKLGKRKNIKQAHYFPPPDSPARIFWVDWVVEEGATEPYQLPQALKDKISRLPRSQRLQYANFDEQVMLAEKAEKGEALVTALDADDNDVAAALSKEVDDDDDVDVDFDRQQELEAFKQFNKKGER
jgi:hypothetical protein